MKHLYYHPGGVVEVGPDGKLVVRCQYCGKLLEPGIFSPEPCTQKTAWRTEIGGWWWEVSVWNCQARLICWKIIDGQDVPGYWTASEDLAEELSRLAEKSVYEAGGAVNISGIYGPSEELERAILRGLRTRKLKVSRKPERVLVSVRLDPGLYQRVKAQAAMEGKKIYEVVEEALRKYLEKA